MVFQHAKIAVLEKSYVYSTNEKGNDLVLFYRKQNSILIWLRDHERSFLCQLLFHIVSDVADLHFRNELVKKRRKLDERTAAENNNKFCHGCNRYLVTEILPYPQYYTGAQRLLILFCLFFRRYRKRIIIQENASTYSYILFLSKIFICSHVIFLLLILYRFLLLIIGITALARQYAVSISLIAHST